MLSQLKIFDEQLRNVLPKDIDLEDVFVPVGEITVAQSLELYKVNQREGKFGVLQKFFEQTEKQMGEERFRSVALGFISTHPSEAFTLTAYHPHFPAFVRANCGEKEYLYDLAKFEWAWHRLGRKDFLEQSPTIREDLSKANPVQAKFVMSPTVAVEKFQYMIGDIYRKMKEGQPYEIVQKEHFVMFWRPDPTTRQRLGLNLWQAHFVKLMKKSVTLDVAISSIMTHTQIEPLKLSQFIDELIEKKVILKVK